jgi:hypothetical protein
MSYSISKIRKFVAGKVLESELNYSPFPHLIIKDVFPLDFYDSLIQLNPFELASKHSNPWVTREESSKRINTTPYYLRNQINLLSNPDIFVEDSPWHLLHNCFNDLSWFLTSIATIWPDYFHIRFGDIFASGNLFSKLDSECFLQRHNSGFYLGPHTDLPTRVFTAIFSFPKEDAPLLGTNLLRHKDPLVRCWGDKHHPPYAFETFSNTGYNRNQLFIFFKTRHSFHSVPLLDDSNIPSNGRLGLQVQCYEPKNGLFDDLSRPDLMQNMHVKTNATTSFKH